MIILIDILDKFYCIKPIKNDAYEKILLSHSCRASRRLHA